MTEVRVAVANSALEEVQEDEEKAKALYACATDIREFLKWWWFLDQETGQPRKLGDVLWAGQEKFVEAMKIEDFIFALKARKLGFTTLECAEDAWVARFRGENERVHLFSRREDAANELLSAVKYGLDRLPPWMRLPYGKDKNNELHLVAGDNDNRIIKAYPADEDTAVEATCTHGHVDEWARMRNPQRVWQALEPTMAKTCRIITTGMGPANYSSKFWAMSKAGDTKFKAFFVPALNRPDRDEAWLAAKRKGMTETESRREYPMTEEDSLYAGVDLIYAGDDLEWVGTNGIGPQDAVDGHDYLKVWDIGRHRDAAVCTVWDRSVEPVQLVHYRRLRGYSYPAIQREVEKTHDLYPGKTVIEDNHAGEAVRENLKLDPDEVDGWKTTPASKPRMISNMEAAIENHLVAWDKEEYQQLHHEFTIYQLPDTNLVQDSVMSSCIAYSYMIDPTKRPKKKGKAKVITVG